MKCVKCGNELEANTKFCASCGAAVEQAKPAAKPAAEKPAAKAAEKPAAKPAAKAADKPAEKVAEKPAEKPAAKKAAPKPAEKPAESASFCNNCGAALEPGAKFCAGCGAGVGAPGAAGATPFAAMPPVQPQKGAKETFEDINKTPDSTDEYDPEEIETFKGICIVAYLGILVLIPTLCFPKIKFVRYHSNQGLILAIINIAFSMVISFFNFIVRLIVADWLRVFLAIIVGIISFAGAVVLLYLVVTGIINAAKGRAKELPFIGKFRILN
ncbi:MAG: Double zinc ribbon [Firmicutes bacterium ADurb.Bin099]|nr:MAG: Double zinc ribbon [Firmicutes bacterium ADurb.Bin099]